jgi:hypothetical protein
VPLGLDSRSTYNTTTSSPEILNWSKKWRQTNQQWQQQHHKKLLLTKIMQLHLKDWDQLMQLVLHCAIGLTLDWKFESLLIYCCGYWCYLRLHQRVLRATGDQHCSALWCRWFGSWSLVRGLTCPRSHLSEIHWRQHDNSSLRIEWRKWRVDLGLVKNDTFHSKVGGRYLGEGWRSRLRLRVI